MPMPLKFIASSSIFHREIIAPSGRMQKKAEWGKKLIELFLTVK